VQNQNHYEDDEDDYDDDYDDYYDGVAEHRTTNQQSTTANVPTQMMLQS
jgi:hypothetical protein